MTYRNRSGTQIVASVSSSLVTDYSSGASTRWRSRPRRRLRSHRCNVGWRVCIVTITSSQVFTTTRRHPTHLYLSGRMHSYACEACYGTPRCIFTSALRASQRRREWRNLRAVSTDFLRIGRSSNRTYNDALHVHATFWRFTLHTYNLCAQCNDNSETKTIYIRMVPTNKDYISFVFF